MIYVTATDSGYGFVTAEERSAFLFFGYGGGLWNVEDCPAAKSWIARVGGVVISRDEAQAVLDSRPPRDFGPLIKFMPPVYKIILE